MAEDVIYINVEEGLKRVMNNAKLFSNLLIKFKNYTHLNDIETALEQGDMESAKNSAHTLKGLAANLSLIELFKQVLELETQLKNGVVDKELLAVVKKVFDQTFIEIDKVIAQNA